MTRCLHAVILTLALAGALGAAPAPPAPAPAAAPATAPATAPAAATSASKPAYRTSFANGDPINDYFTAMALRFGVMIVQPPTLDAFMLKDAQLPANFADALKILRENLQPQGFAAIESFSAAKHIVVHVVTEKDAKRMALEESPVSYGTAGEKVDITDPERQVTHLFPVNHLDMLEALRHAAMEDKQVQAEATGGGDAGSNLILTGPALKVQHAVEALAKIDALTEGAIIARTLQLQHLDAQSTADTLNQGFAQDRAPMKAVVDQRTNSIVVTGPEERVLEIMVALISQDARRGPILPRPEVVPPKVERPSDFTPPPRLPEISQPETKPSASRGGPAGSLDETQPGGDNARPRGGVLARRAGSIFSLFVNEGVFL